MQKPPNEETSDPLLESMMNDAFGPPDTNNNTDGGEHRLERGLDAVARRIIGSMPKAAACAGRTRTPYRSTSRH